MANTITPASRLKADESVSMIPGLVLGTIIAIIAFCLSFDALRLLYLACGVNPYLSWGGPICIDGTILLTTWAAWGFRKGAVPHRWYPWTGFVVFSLFSIIGNALHAYLNDGGLLPQWVPVAVMSIPPIALMYTTHLIVIIAGDRYDKKRLIAERIEQETLSALDVVQREMQEDTPATVNVPAMAEKPTPVEPESDESMAPVEDSSRQTVEGDSADLREEFMSFLSGNDALGDAAVSEPAEASVSVADAAPADPVESAAVDPVVVEQLPVRKRVARRVVKDDVEVDSAQGSLF
ncbi:DUF2637 domain-containing protein [Bifidobacterium sp. SO1]|uniref:DUF2637 domain-containing protein n=1 Tax=Bifidobacterium sp. SO1 TaxID=2809029 RepID=UPI001BDD304C|nr:DUF2637 domain-containing protein [Bifidobacterium sp. SO1]MBT1162197.1 DUF2637 domain-containing protein [Bifidobacterium sp. SO1]